MGLQIGDPGEARIAVDIGGIANVTVVQPGRPTAGFATEPGNTLLDYGIGRTRGSRASRATCPL